VVLTPGDLEDSFQLTVAAVNLAEQLQGPVYICLDQALGQNSATVAPFDFDTVRVRTGRRLAAEDLATLPEYRRYAVTGDGISPLTFPGMRDGMSLITGNERNDWGHVSSEAANRKVQMDKRMRKVEALLPDLPAGRRWGDPDAGVGLIGIGMEVGVMVEAEQQLRKAGVAVACLQPRTLWPVLRETLDFIASRERVYVIEHNAEGQLAHLLASVGAPRDRMSSILKYDGVPLLPGELAGLVMQAEEAVQ
jgi:2-oxoglutarate ferredoxin oxidoreductase subunit alpha